MAVTQPQHYFRSSQAYVARKYEQGMSLGMKRSSYGNKSQLDSTLGNRAFLVVTGKRINEWR